MIFGKTVRLVPKIDFQFDTVCPICGDEWQFGQLVSILDCKHALHRTCARPWFQDKSKCPTCRKDVTIQEKWRQTPEKSYLNHRLKNLRAEHQVEGQDESESDLFEEDEEVEFSDEPDDMEEASIGEEHQDGVAAQEFSFGRVIPIREEVEVLDNGETIRRPVFDLEELLHDS